MTPLALRPRRSTEIQMLDTRILACARVEIRHHHYHHQQQHRDDCVNQGRKLHSLAVQFNMLPTHGRGGQERRPTDSRKAADRIICTRSSVRKPLPPPPSQLLYMEIPHNSDAGSTVNARRNDARRLSIVLQTVSSPFRRQELYCGVVEQ